MGRGEVDINWARQHHSLWLEKQIQNGRVRDGGVAPAE
jgi:formate dehydrogenase subunit gamma